MPIVQGSANKLNLLAGTTTTMYFSNVCKRRYANRVLEDGTFLFDDEGRLYHTDGKRTVKELMENPVADPNYAVLTAEERKLIANHGKADGFVVTDSNNKIPDEQLPIIKDGLINDEYLNLYVDDHGIFRPECIPDSMRRHLRYVKDYDTLLTMADEDKEHGPVFVIDATNDPAINDEVGGWAMYVWDPDHQTGDNPNVRGHWFMVFKGQGIDLDLGTFTTYSSVVDAGAVMYDHSVALAPATLTQFSNLDMPTIEHPKFARWEAYQQLYMDEIAGVPIELDDRFADPLATHKITLWTKWLYINNIKDDRTQLPPETEYSFTGTVAEINERFTKAQVPPQGVVSRIGIIRVDLDDGYHTKELKIETLPYLTKVDSSVLEETVPEEIHIKYGETLKLPIKFKTKGIYKYDNQTFRVLTTNSCLEFKFGKYSSYFYSGSTYIQANINKLNEYFDNDYLHIKGKGADGTIELKLMECSIGVANIIFDDAPYMDNLARMYYQYEDVAMHWKFHEVVPTANDYIVQLIPYRCSLVYNNSDKYAYGSIFEIDVPTGMVADYNADVLAKVKLTDFESETDCGLYIRVLRDNRALAYEHKYLVRKLSAINFSMAKELNSYFYPQYFNFSLKIDDDRYDEIHTMRIDVLEGSIIYDKTPGPYSYDVYKYATDPEPWLIYTGTVAEIVQKLSSIYIGRYGTTKIKVTLDNDENQVHECTVVSYYY